MENILYGESKNGNFAVAVEGDATWGAVEALGELYSPICDLDRLSDDEFARMMLLEKRLKGTL